MRETTKNRPFSNVFIVHHFYHIPHFCIKTHTHTHTQLNTRKNKMRETTKNRPFSNVFIVHATLEISNMLNIRTLENEFSNVLLFTR
jgi:hypothetical protein